MKLREYALIAVALICVLSAAWAWYRPAPAPISPTVALPEVKTITKWVLSDCKPSGEGSTHAGQPVIASGVIGKAPQGGEVITTITPSTGETQTYFRPKPRPLFGFENAKELGLRYGGAESELYGRWSFLRIGSFYGALYGAIDTDSDAFAGIEVSYRF